MKKTIIFSLILSSCLPSFSRGADFSDKDTTFSASGLIGGYYGISETKKQNSVSSLPNRWIYRSDVLFGADHRFSKNSSLGIFANTTLVFKQHDTSYRDGDWRFYPFVKSNSALGIVTLGYTHNAARELHQGAKEITFFSIDDSNMTYYLSNPNWKNGKHAVSFATPKSTAIMNDGRAFKIKYISPEFSGLKLGFSYTPKNENRRGMVSRYAHYEKPEDGYTLAAQKRWELKKDTTLRASFGYGIFNRTDNEMSFGLSLEKNNFTLAAGYKNAWINGNKNPISTAPQNKHLPALFDNYRESNAYNFSIGYKYRNFQTNLASLHTEASNTRNSDDLYIWSNVYKLNNHLNLYLVGARLHAKGAEKYTDDNSKGWAAVTGLGLKF